MIVKQLLSNDQRVEGPGVYLLADNQHTYGIKPMCVDDREQIPFSWAAEFPPVGEFVQRFEQYWTADKTSEVWIGGPYNPHGIYWSRYDPRALGRNANGD